MPNKAPRKNISAVNPPKNGYAFVDVRFLVSMMNLTKKQFPDHGRALDVAIQRVLELAADEEFLSEIVYSRGFIEINLALDMLLAARKEFPNHPKTALGTAAANLRSVSRGGSCSACRYDRSRGQNHGAFAHRDTQGTFRNSCGRHMDESRYRYHDTIDGNLWMKQPGNSTPMSSGQIR